MEINFSNVSSCRFLLQKQIPQAHIYNVGFIRLVIFKYSINSLIFNFNVHEIVMSLVNVITACRQNWFMKFQNLRKS